MWPLVVLFGVHQVSMLLGQELNKFDIEWDALQDADLSGKPLLVVGGPWGSSNNFRRWWGTHTAGDVCIDISPTACEGAPVALQGDIRDLPFEDKEFGSVLSSHVLEHMETLEDLTLAWGELHRVADNVHVAVPSAALMWAYFAPEHHLWVQRMDNYTLVATERTTGRHGTITALQEV